MPTTNSATRQVRRDLVSSGTRRPPNQPRSGGPGQRRWRRRGAVISLSPVVRSASDITTARQQLTRFVEDQAQHTADEVGFGWRPDSDAPDRYDVLIAAYQHSTENGDNLPVSDLYCESTIYTSPAANMAFRFWHDVNHVRRGLSFELVDELELANWHLAELTGTGLGPETTAWQLLHADLVGQISVMALVRRFPLDQGSFSIDCVRRGFDEAVLTECRLLASA